MITDFLKAFPFPKAIARFPAGMTHLFASVANKAL
jgi:hypothetical protein